MTGDPSHHGFDEHRFRESLQVSEFKGAELLHAEMKRACQLFRAQSQRLSALLDASSDFGEAAWGGAPGISISVITDSHEKGASEGLDMNVMPFG